MEYGKAEAPSSFLSFHQESYVRQIVPSQCLAQPMAMSLAVVRSWGEQAVSTMGQTSRCCMVCLMPQSQVSGSLENPHFNIFTHDRPTCVRNRLSAFQVVQGFSAPAGRCSSELMSTCTPGARVDHSIAPSGQVSRFEAWHHSDMSIERVPFVRNLPCPFRTTCHRSPDV